jgi:hypothetical protein
MSATLLRFQILYFHLSVVVIPPPENWGYSNPRTQNGQLHPDSYWYARIIDLRGKKVKQEGETELWVKVSWFYTQDQLKSDQCLTGAQKKNLLMKM